MPSRAAAQAMASGHDQKDAAYRSQSRGLHSNAARCRVSSKVPAPMVTVIVWPVSVGVTATSQAPPRSDQRRRQVPDVGQRLRSTPAWGRARSATGYRLGGCGGTPQVDARIDGVAIHHGELIGSELQVVEGGNVLLKLSHAARADQYRSDSRVT